MQCGLFLLILLIEEGDELAVDYLWVFFWHEVSSLDGINLLEIGHRLFISWPLDSIKISWKMENCIIFGYDQICLGHHRTVRPGSSQIPISADMKTLTKRLEHSKDRNNFGSGTI